MCIVNSLLLLLFFHFSLTLPCHFWTTFLFSLFNIFSTYFHLICSFSIVSSFSSDKKVSRFGKLFENCPEKSFPFWKTFSFAKIRKISQYNHHNLQENFKKNENIIISPSLVPAFVLSPPFSSFFFPSCPCSILSFVIFGVISCEEW